MSRRYIVTYTSMIIEADSADEAIERAQDQGGGNWEAEQLLTLEDFVADEDNEFVCPLGDAVFPPRDYLSIASMTRIIQEHIADAHAQA